MKTIFLSYSLICGQVPISIGMPEQDVKVICRDVIEISPRLLVVIQEGKVYDLRIAEGVVVGISE